MKLSLINAIGCVILLALAATQWVKHEHLRHEALNQQKELHLVTQQRDEAQEKNTALQADLDDLKKAVEETQKAAATASAAALQAETTAKSLSETNATLQAQLAAVTAERDALQASTITWQNAIKDRDAAIAKLNADFITLRQKLDQAIAQLKKAGAR